VGHREAPARKGYGPDALLLSPGPAHRRQDRAAWARWDPSRGRAFAETDPVDTGPWIRPASLFSRSWRELLGRWRRWRWFSSASARRRQLRLALVDAEVLGRRLAVVLASLQEHVDDGSMTGVADDPAPAVDLDPRLGAAPEFHRKRQW
jgi:hypothetical protein